MPERDVNEQLEQLRRAYRSQLPLRLGQIESAAAAVQGGDAAALRTLHRLVHKLSGSAACYGFAELGERAAAAELHLQAMLDGETANAAERLVTLLGELRQAITALRVCL